MKKFKLLVVFVGIISLFLMSNVISFAKAQFSQSQLEGSNGGGGHTHTYEYTSNETQHWKECSGCSEIEADSAKDHKLNWKNESGKHWQECTVCGYKTAEKNHDYTWKVDDKGSTDISDDVHYKLCACGVTSSRARHTLGEWQETSDGTMHYKVCSVCSKEVGKATHTYGEFKKLDTDNEEGHYKECECGKRSEEGRHKYDGKQDKHICTECKFESEKYPHHGFGIASFPAVRCSNSDCGAALVLSGGDEIKALPRIEDYYMVGSGKDWEKSLSSVSYTTNLTPYKTQDGSDIMELTVQLRGFKHANYATHMGNVNNNAPTSLIGKIPESEYQLWYTLPAQTLTQPFSSWDHVSSAWIITGTSEIKFAYGNKSYTSTSIPDGHWQTIQPFLGSYPAGGTDYSRLFCNGGEHPAPTPIPASISIVYRDTDGNKIDGAPEDLTRYSDVICWLNGPTGNSHGFKADLNTLDSLGWRYVGYKTGNQLYVPEDLTINKSNLNKNSSGSLTPLLGNQNHYVVFVFEPVKVTVKHINKDREEIKTNKNCTYELPKLIGASGHSCTSLNCNQTEKYLKTHINTSLNKYLWPGYVLTDYTLKTKGGDVFGGKTYNLNTDEPIADATTRTATKEDETKYGKNTIPQELYQKKVEIRTDIDTGNEKGKKQDIELIFNYTNIGIEVLHNYFEDGSLIPSMNDKGNLNYSMTLNGHYFTVSSLIVDGEEHILPETGGAYNLKGYIISKMDIIEKGKIIHTKEFNSAHITNNATEAGRTNNLSYYLISSNQLSDDPELNRIIMDKLKRVENDIKIAFYYQKMPMLTIKHVDELGNKLWPDEYMPLENEFTAVSSKNLKQWNYSYSRHILDGVAQATIPGTANNDIRTVNVQKNGENDRELIFVYTQEIPKLKVIYVDTNGITVAEPTEYKMDKDSVSTSAKDLTNKSYEYQRYELYEGDNKGTTLTSGGQSVTVNVNKNGNDRLLIFIYLKKDNAEEIDSTQIKSEAVILKSNYRDNGEEYNVLRAIPTSEDLYANVITDSFLLSNVIEQTEKTGKIYIKFVQAYYDRNDADSSQTGTDNTTDKIYAISSSSYVPVEMKYSYFSARNVQLNIISKAIVKNAVIKTSNENGQVTLTPNYTKTPSLIYEEGGKLEFNDLDVSNVIEQGKLAEYINGLSVGAYNLASGFYNYKKESNGDIYIEYLLPEVEYTEVSSSDMQEIVKQYQDNNQMVTKAAEDNNVKVTMDKLEVQRENDSIVTILSGMSLPISREYTVITLEGMITPEGKPVIDLNPDAPIIDKNILYRKDGIFVDIVDNKEYKTTADVYYKAHQRVNPDTLTVEPITTQETFIAGKTYTKDPYSIDDEGNILVNAKKDIVGNSVWVHTPVVNNTSIITVGDTDTNNQLIPTVTEKVLVLGQEFTVKVPHNGQHINENGYGNKAYNYKGLEGKGNSSLADSQVANNFDSFAKSRKIRFTFGVYYGSKYYPLQSNGYTEWIELNTIDSNGGIENREKIEFKFRIPEWEKELWKGNNHHTIETRVIAENTTGDLVRDNITEDGANKTSTKYVAKKAVNVKVIGELLDLELRATNDPGWTQLVSSLGVNDFPLGQPGQNKNTAYKYGLKLGTSVYFDITTTGWTGDTTSAIDIKPKYFFVNKNGGTPTEVDLYFKESASGPYKKLTESAIKVTTVMNQDVYKGTGYISRFAGVESGIRKKFVMDAGRELSTTYTTLTTSSVTNSVLSIDGRKPVNYSQSITLNPIIHLPYETRLVYKKAIESLSGKYGSALPTTVAGTDYCIGHWYGAMRLPSTTVAVNLGSIPAIDKSNVKKDGYIIVAFEEVISKENGGSDYLAYDPIRYNLEGLTKDDTDFRLPSGALVDWPNKEPGDSGYPGKPVVIYELIADRIDYETSGTH